MSAPHAVSRLLLVLTTSLVVASFLVRDVYADIAGTLRGPAGMPLAERVSRADDQSASGTLWREIGEAVRTVDIGALLPTGPAVWAATFLLLVLWAILGLGDFGDRLAERGEDARWAFAARFGAVAAAVVLAVAAVGLWFAGAGGAGPRG